MTKKSDKIENQVKRVGSYPDPNRRFFGRRHGPTLSKKRAERLKKWLPRLEINLNDFKFGKDCVFDPRDLFQIEVRSVWLEVGFGKGEHLAALAKAHPDIGFIGCEPFINGVAALVDRIVDEKINNIRLYTDDARQLLDHLPDASLERVFLLHPDPWPKKRHAKRRFIGAHNLDLVSRVLRDGGEFRVGTDHPLYREWTAVQMAYRSDFKWLVEQGGDWWRRPDDWPATRYEAKAIEGRAAYLRYQKLNRAGFVPDNVG